MLTGTAINTISLWTNSLSNENEKRPEVNIRKVGVKKQWATHAIDIVIANLDDELYTYK